jgi:hypothetical protein
LSELPMLGRSSMQASPLVRKPCRLPVPPPPFPLFHEDRLMWTVLVP